MKRIDGWEKIKAEKGDFITLPAGSYYCEIINAEITASRSGNEMLVLDLDIVDGQFKGYYRQKYDNDKSGATKRWGCKYYQLTEGEHVGRFKGLIENILESNDGYKWTWSEDTLKGKLIGGLFRREEFTAQDGSSKWAVKCYKLIATSLINTDYIPKDKPLENSGNSGFGKPVLDDEIIPF